jgi:hypothetical protein
MFDVRFQMFDYHLTSSISPLTFEDGGGTGIRTPDIQLAKLALYQLSYTPVWTGLSPEGYFFLQQTLDSAFFVFLDLPSFRSTGF